jgi:glycosyltransferase involved in cell wall biosynthesis
LNILYLHNKTNISGGEQSLLNLWINIDRKKYIPYLLVPGDGPFGRAAGEIGVNTGYCRVPKIHPKNFIGIIQAIRGILKFCRSRKIDIIHSYTPRNNILAAVSARILGVPVVWHERNLIFGNEKDISRMLAFLPDRIVCNSHAIAKRFLRSEKLPDRVAVVINGVNLNNFRPRDARRQIVDRYRLDEKKVVGLVSNLGERKMPEYFIQACPYVAERFPDCRFLIVGGEFGDEDAGRTQALIEMTSKLNIQDRVVFTGFVSNVDEVVSAFDIGVAVTEKEACSRAILEMMACGKPVVCFDTGGNAELVRDGVTGVLVPFGNIKGLAEAVVDLLANDDKRNEMGRNARRSAERDFDVKKNAAKIQRIYTSLVERRTQAPRYVII